MSNKPTIGELLRTWREKARLSQFELSARSGVSGRHLSFLETGRSKPSREMVLHLASNLEVTHRVTNQLLLAAGFSPAYQSRSFDAPELEDVRRTLHLLLDAHDPFPAMVVDCEANLVMANSGMSLFLDLVDPELLTPPVNVMRLLFHPNGLSPHIVNAHDVLSHILHRLERQLVLSESATLRSLYDEIREYMPHVDAQEVSEADDVVMPVRIRYDSRELAFYTTIATFGTPMDVTVSELIIEQFFPADTETANVLSALGQRSS